MNLKACDGLTKDTLEGGGQKRTNKRAECRREQKPAEVEQEVMGATRAEIALHPLGQERSLK